MGRAEVTLSDEPSMSKHRTGDEGDSCRTQPWAPAVISFTGAGCTATTSACTRLKAASSKASAMPLRTPRNSASGKHADGFWSLRSPGMLQRVGAPSVTPPPHHIRHGICESLGTSANGCQAVAYMSCRLFAAARDDGCPIARVSKPPSKTGVSFNGRFRLVSNTLDVPPTS
eukprot:scaffold42866_cov522-Isochrysis_galbana.AAC.1